MLKPDILFHEHFKPLQKSVVLLHGVFDKSFFDLFKGRKEEKFIVMEGRPSLEAAKTSSRELIKRKIKPILITDNMAGFLFSKDMVKEVWLAYNKADNRGAMCYAGASILSILAWKYYIPVYCYPDAGKKNPELLGKAKDITYFNGVRVAPVGTKGYVPLMEWVPGKCIEEKYESRTDK